jgi:hypothetical protein
MVQMAFIFTLVISSIALILGILIWNEMAEGLPCPDIGTNPDGNLACERGKSIGWTVVGIFPITLFFGLNVIISKFVK